MLRFFDAAALVVGGVLFGAIMTFGHQASVFVGGFSLPWGLIVALLGVAALLAGTRLLTARRRPTGWLAAGIVAAVVVLSMRGPGGSVLVPNNLAGVVWSLSPTLIALFIVLWPAPRRLDRNRADRLGAVERTTS